MTERIDAPCGGSRYFRALEASTGACHRYPPIFAGDSSPREAHHWRFPVVSIHGWCGEYQPPP